MLQEAQGGKGRRAGAAICGRTAFPTLPLPPSPAAHTRAASSELRAKLSAAEPFTGLADWTIGAGPAAASACSPAKLEHQGLRGLVAGPRCSRTCC